LSSSTMVRLRSKRSEVEGPWPSHHEHLITFQFPGYAILANIAPEFVALPFLSGIKRSTIAPVSKP
jgi:hypothetical protein